MHCPGEFHESSHLVSGTYGQLLTQTLHQQSSHLTLSVHYPDDLTNLQLRMRDQTVPGQTNWQDILMAAIGMTQKSGMALNVNAFITAMYYALQPSDHELILDALRKLFQWCGINFPSADMDAIFGACQR